MHTCEIPYPTPNPQLFRGSALTSNDRLTAPRGAYTGVGRTAPLAAGLCLWWWCDDAVCSGCVEAPPCCCWPPWLERRPGDGADWNLGGTDADTASKLNRRPSPPLPLPPPLPSTGRRATTAAAADDADPALPGVVCVVPMAAGVAAAAAAPLPPLLLLLPPEVRGACLACVYVYVCKPPHCRSTGRCLGGRPVCAAHTHTHTTATHAPWHGGLQALSVAALEDGPRAQRVHPLPLLVLVLVLAPNQPRRDGGRRRRRL